MTRNLLGRLKDFLSEDGNFEPGKSKTLVFEEKEVYVSYDSGIGKTFGYIKTSEGNKKEFAWDMYSNRFNFIE